MPKGGKPYPKKREVIKDRNKGNKPLMKDNKPITVPRSVTGGKKLKRSKPF